MLTFFDANISYRMKIFDGRADLTIQLNGTNIFNQDIITIARYNNINSANPVAHRYYFNAPRQIYLTTTINF